MLHRWWLGGWFQGQLPRLLRAERLRSLLCRSPYCARGVLVTLQGRDPRLAHHLLSLNLSFPVCEGTGGGSLSAGGDGEGRARWHNGAHCLELPGRCHCHWLRLLQSPRPPGQEQSRGPGFSACPWPQAPPRSAHQCVREPGVAPDGRCQDTRPRQAPPRRLRPAGACAELVGTLITAPSTLFVYTWCQVLRDDTPIRCLIGVVKTSRNHWGFGQAGHRKGRACPSVSQFSMYTSARVALPLGPAPTVSWAQPPPWLCPQGRA